MNITFAVTFEHKDKGHGTSIYRNSLKEVMEEIEKVKPEYECTSLELIWDITDLIKDKK